MNCQRFEELVSEVARCQMMDAELRAEALAHSDECLACTERLRDEQALTRGLRALSTHMKSLGPATDLESRLRSAIQQQNRRVVQLPTRNMSLRYWGPVAAAVLLFVAGVIAINWHRNSTTPGANAVAGNQNKNGAEQKPEATDKNDQSATTSAQESVKQVVAQKQRRRPRRIKATVPSGDDVVANHAREIATDFIPLGYMNTVSLQDGGHIVRVELPRSAMVSFGLPVNMDRLNEKVKADVWLGVDGLAHAIRFVQ